MDERPRRFVQLGVLGTALEDPVEQDALVRYYVNVLLPLEITREKIAELIVVELNKALITGPKNSFLALSAENRVELNAINAFLQKIFGSEWKEQEKEIEKEKEKLKEKDSGS